MGRQCEGEDPGQGGYPAGSAALDLRGEAAGGWPHLVGLQHPEGVHAPLGLAPEGWDTNLCEDEDPGQGGYPAGSAALDLRREAAGGWPHLVGLQHPEGVDSPLGAAPAWWYADLCQDTDRQDH